MREVRREEKIRNEGGENREDRRGGEDEGARSKEQRRWERGRGLGREGTAGGDQEKGRKKRWGQEMEHPGRNGRDACTFYRHMHIQETHAHSHTLLLTHSPNY